VSLCVFVRFSCGPAITESMGPSTGSAPHTAQEGVSGLQYLYAKRARTGMFSPETAVLSGGTALSFNYPETAERSHHGTAWRHARELSCGRGHVAWACYVQQTERDWGSVSGR
jgi:hypothetical protein